MWTGRFQSRANWSHDTRFLLDSSPTKCNARSRLTAVPPCIVEVTISKASKLGKKVQHCFPDDIPGQLDRDYQHDDENGSDCIS